ncbi:F1F0 ATP synthase assembly protein Atp11 [Pyrenophora tritici-repentis]|uniref:Uncharacterized protein n=1 Tax=Pyrenophora tritici-repentis TaxID=45151 RepID=A0A834RNZ2_9PLEO|nr:F1F0 ATP synthase assembly protein Atp11 [Pyrenophora tritici-repentis]KAF7567650.1 hypothetical protein PtrM4_142410 [Pyrenophora tritici-repentis]KAI2479345.1 F1F0 ATP synthase assembly protein Atp11 [Pyrenophora tritici-repentis]
MEGREERQDNTSDMRNTLASQTATEPLRQHEQQAGRVGPDAVDLALEQHNAVALGQLEVQRRSRVRMRMHPAALELVQTRHG